MFNLKKHLLQKQANYDGIQGYWIAQTRAWQNCLCHKQKKGASAQNAWQECLDQYQKGDGKLDWVADYVPEESSKIAKIAQAMGGGYQLQMGPYWKRIKIKIEAGKTTGQAVLETLEECQKDAQKIPAK